MTATCPHCAAEIDHIELFAHAPVMYTWHPAKSGPDAFGPVLIDGETSDPYDFACPACRESLTDDQRHTIEFDLTTDEVTA
jgi:hypothetical protein